MSRTSVARRSSDARPAFADVLCAVDGSRGSRVAIHQAICLCGSAARIRFVVVHHEVADRSSAETDLSEMRARTALDEAVAVARGSELETSANLLRGADPSELLLAEADKQDLLVVGCHGGSRPNGMMLGSTAAQLAHQAEVPLLIARRTIDAGNFPQSVLLATDGTEGSWAAARVATRLARARRSELRLVNVPDGRHAERYREVLKQLAVIEKVTGVSAKIADSPDHVADRICEAAKARQASLIAIGRRGLSGIKALGSVSDRVVRRAQCSLLVVP